MNALILFGAAFVGVFFMGFQSLCVNSGQKLLAVTNSTMIGAMNLALYKVAPHAESGPEIIAYIIAGPIAILCSMKVHAWMRARRAA